MARLLSRIIDSLFPSLERQVRNLIACRQRLEVIEMSPEDYKELLENLEIEDSPPSVRIKGVLVRPNPHLNVGSFRCA